MSSLALREQGRSDDTMFAVFFLSVAGLSLIVTTVAVYMYSSAL